MTKANVVTIHVALGCMALKLLLSWHALEIHDNMETIHIIHFGNARIAAVPLQFRD